MIDSQPVEKLRERIIDSLDNLPPEGLKEIADFLDYVHFKFPASKTSRTPYKPIALEGLWENVDITDEDIAEVRKEMWGCLDKREI